MQTTREDFEGLGLFVCTHMSRDSRCGLVGGRVARKLASLWDAEGLQRVRVFQASHVGGHKVGYLLDGILMSVCGLTLRAHIECLS